MSETLTNPRPQEPIDPTLAAEWFSVADTVAPFNQQTIINRSNGPEEFILHDVVGKQVRDEAGNRVDSIPTVVLARADGTMENVGVADFLTYVGADSFGLRHIIDEAKKDQSAHNESIGGIEQKTQVWSEAVFAGETAVKAVVDAQSAEDKDSYDYLYLPLENDASTSIELNEVREYAASAEKDPRLEVLFAPVKTIEEYNKENPREDIGYDHLFMEDGPERDAIIAKASAEDRKRTMEENKYTKITDESRAMAARQLSQVRSKDSKINRILQNYEQKHTDATNLVDVIRTDSDVRYQIGEYLLKSKLMKRIAHMPERIVQNTQKNPNHRGYAQHNQIVSREYATLLALSMIDGTYVGTGKGDEIESHPVTGDVIVGQHRAAALELLS